MHNIYVNFICRFNNIIKLKDQQMSQTSSLLKNMACVLFAIVAVLISSIVMSQFYFSQQIENRIQTISQLTDIKYPYWGQQPNPSNSLYTQTVSLYNLQLTDSQIHSTKSNISTTFDFTYEYQNISFQQGDSGRLDFINKWELKQRDSTNGETETINGAIKTLNLGADKIYNYDFYAPPQRKIALLYNSILDVLTSDFLELFYATYLHQYFFKDETLVLQTVFKPLKFDDVLSKKIYEDNIYGWNSPEKLKNWAILSLKGEQFAKTTPFYEKLITDLELNEQQIASLVFEKSAISNMISALNGTIVTKAMQSKYFGYKCDGFCTNQELAAFQISSAFLTKDPLFASLGLNLKTKDLNTTFFTDIEYTTFCQNNQELNCLPDSTKAAFFTQHYFGNFQQVNFLWKNQQRVEQIENNFQLPEGTGKSIIEYVKFVFGKYIEKYENHISWGQTNYNNLYSSINKYYELFMVEIYSRGFVNKFLIDQNNSCQDYFSNQTELVDKICREGSGWNLDEGLPAVRNYFRAYFFFQESRNLFKQITGFSDIQVINFFNAISTSNSIFAQQIEELQHIYGQNFQCKDGKDSIFCSSGEMFCMQWGQDKVLSNLPQEIFPKMVSSINQWDEEGVLNGFNPDYFSITGEKVPITKCQEILSSEQKGILSWFNLINLAFENKQKNLLKYIVKNVVNINMGGILIEKNSQDLLNGYNSSVIDGKKKLDVEDGGAPWMDNFITLIKTNNKAEIKNNQLLEVPQFDTINTGIYDGDKTREISHIWGQTKSSSKYVVYKGTKTDDSGKEIEVDIFEQYVTDREISGTNLLGFQTQIGERVNLQIYLTQAYQPFTLVFEKVINNYENKNINAFYYTVSDGGEAQSFIGTQELNQNSFKLNSDSYFIIDSFTGLTLEFSLSYSIQANPLLTKFLFNSSESVTLYDSKVSYKKNGLQDFVDISSMQDSRNLFLVLGSVIATLCFISGIILLIINSCKKKKLHEETLLGSSTPSDNPHNKDTDTAIYAAIECPD